MPRLVTYIVIGGLASLGFVSADDANQKQEADQKKKIAVELAGIFMGTEMDDASLRKIVANQLSEMVAPLGIPAEDLDKFNAASEEATKVVTAKRFIEMLADGYVKYLSLDDLNSALAFYKSPAGKALLKEKENIEIERRKQQGRLILEVAETAKKRFTELKSEESKK